MWLKQHEQLVRDILWLFNLLSALYTDAVLMWSLSVDIYYSILFYFLGNNMITLIGQVLKYINIPEGQQQFSVRIWQRENLQPYLIYIVPIYMKFYSGFTNEILDFEVKQSLGLIIYMMGKIFNRMNVLYWSHMHDAEWNHFSVFDPGGAVGNCCFYMWR